MPDTHDELKKICDELKSIGIITKSMYELGDALLLLGSERGAELLAQANSLCIMRDNIIAACMRAAKSECDTGVDIS